MEETRERERNFIRGDDEASRDSVRPEDDGRRATRKSTISSITPAKSFPFNFRPLKLLKGRSGLAPAPAANLDLAQRVHLSRMRDRIHFPGIFSEYP